MGGAIHFLVDGVRVSGNMAAVGLISDAGLQATPTFFYSVRHMNHRVVVGEPVHGYLWSSIV